MGKDLNGKELGKGLYQRKDGRYEAKAIVNGVKIDIYDTKLTTLKKNFEKAKEEAKKGIAGKFVDATLNEWFEFWFDTYKVPTIKKQSIRPMKNKYRNTFGKYIGTKKIKNLKNLDIQCALNELLQTSVAKSSIKEALGRITACLESARNNGLISSNPSFDIIVPWEPEEPCRRFLTTKEQNIFLLESESSWYKEMFYVMFCTGMRIGEVGGLKWQDIDFQHKCFNLNQALMCEYENGIKRIEFTTLKTPNSYRKIPFMGGVEEMLKQWKKKQQKEKKRLGHRWRSQGEFEDLVFTTSLGSPVIRHVAQKEINNIVKNINEKEKFEAKLENREPIEFERMSPHAIRHTFASRCFEKNMNPKVVQKIMGHARYSTTIDIYTHVMGSTFCLEVEKFGDSIIEDNEKSISDETKNSLTKLQNIV